MLGVRGERSNDLICKNYKPNIGTTDMILYRLLHIPKSSKLEQ